MIRTVASLSLHLVIWREILYIFIPKMTINKLAHKLKGKIHIFSNTIWFESWTKAISIRTIMKTWDGKIEMKVSYSWRLVSQLPSYIKALWFKKKKQKNQKTPISKEQLSTLSFFFFFFASVSISDKRKEKCLHCGFRTS